MRKITLFILGSLGCMVANAQEILPVQQDTLPKSGMLTLQGGGFYHGNAIRTDFAKTLLFGGYIDDEMKDRSMSNAAGRPRNRFGGALSSELEYRNLKGGIFGKDNWGYLIKAGYEQFGGVQYTRDLFSLVFKGNAHVQNNMADLSSTEVFSIAYQKIGFGIVDKKTNSSMTLNVVNGQNFTRLRMPNGEYRQSPETDSVSLLLKGNFDHTPNRSFSNGIGLAIDAEFRIPIPWRKTKQAWVQIKAQNIGVVYFYGSTSHYNVDTMYRYSGFKINQLFDSGITGDEFSLMDSLGLQSTNGGQAIWLPGFIQLAKIVDRNNPAKFQPFFGMNIYTHATYLPQIFAGAHYQPIPALAIGAQVSYGGFGELRGGMYLDLKLKNFFFGVGTQDVYGLFSNNAFGQSVIGRLSWHIN
jgi:hypothetical protein